MLRPLRKNESRKPLEDMDELELDEWFNSIHRHTPPRLRVEYEELFLTVKSFKNKLKDSNKDTRGK